MSYQGPRGSKHPWALLHEDDVLDIRERYAAGETQTALAREFHVSGAHISSIVNGYKWRHVGGPIGVRRGQRGAPSHAFTTRKER